MVNAVGKKEEKIVDPTLLAAVTTGDKGLEVYKGEVARGILEALVPDGKGMTENEFLILINEPIVGGFPRTIPMHDLTNFFDGIPDHYLDSNFAINIFAAKLNEDTIYWSIATRLKKYRGLTLKIAELIHDDFKNSGDDIIENLESFQESDRKLILEMLIKRNAGRSVIRLIERYNEEQMDIVDMFIKAGLGEDIIDGIRWFPAEFHSAIADKLVDAGLGIAVRKSLADFNGFIGSNIPVGEDVTVGDILDLRKPLSRAPADEFIGLSEGEITMIDEKIIVLGRMRYSREIERLDFIDTIPERLFGPYLARKVLTSGNFGLEDSLKVLFFGKIRCTGLTLGTAALIIHYFKDYVTAYNTIEHYIASFRESDRENIMRLLENTKKQGNQK